MANRLEQALHAAGVPFIMQTSRAPNHAIELAKQAVDDGARVVVAAGGDGTVSKVINGLARAGAAATNVALAIFPIGTGNDFAAWETVDGNIHSHEDDTLMISVGNRPRTGGDFYVTRDAVMDDGLLDLGISAPHLSRGRLIGIMVRALRNQPLNPDDIRIEHCRRFSLTCANGTSIHVDGEVLTECAMQVEVAVLPSWLRVLADEGI